MGDTWPRLPHRIREGFTGSFINSTDMGRLLAWHSCRVGIQRETPALKKLVFGDGQMNSKNTRVIAYRQPLSAHGCADVLSPQGPVVLTGKLAPPHRPELQETQMTS